MNLFEFQEEVKRSIAKSEPCEGLIFRCELSSWVGSDNDVNFKERYRFIKSKSCPGCDQCGYLWDNVHERIADEYMRDSIVRTEGEHGQLYQLKVTNISTDWETGIVDDWDIEFVKYEEPIEEQKK